MANMILPNFKQEYKLFMERDVKALSNKRFQFLGDDGKVRREDISDFIFEFTDGGRETFSVHTIRKNDSKTDPTKKAGDIMVLTGRYGACKASLQASKERRPELDTSVQYPKNKILRMCVTSVDGEDYTKKYPPEKRTRSFGVENIIKISANNEEFEVKP